MSDDSANWVERFTQTLKADTKKTVLLGVLTVVLLVVVGRMLVPDSDMPETAVASPVAPIAAKKDPVTPRSRPVRQPPVSAAPRSGGRPGDKSRAPGRSAQEESPKRFSRTVSTEHMERSLHRNIFSTPDWSRFQPSDGFLRLRAQESEGTGRRVSVWQQMRTALKEQQKRRREELALVADELDRLKLQSTMTGSEPMAYISGRLVREGDTIEGFSVVKIRDKRVSLRVRGLIHELTMP